jgi:hypothetical protein
MEVKRFSETSENFDRAIMRHIPENSTFGAVILLQKIEPSESNHDREPVSNTDIILQPWSSK